MTDAQDGRIFVDRPVVLAEVKVTTTPTVKSASDILKGRRFTRQTS
jgi:hypothetical protein